MIRVSNLDGAPRETAHAAGTADRSEKRSDRSGAGGFSLNYRTYAISARVNHFAMPRDCRSSLTPLPPTPLLESFRPDIAVSRSYAACSPASMLPALRMRNDSSTTIIRLSREKCNVKVRFPLGSCDKMMTTEKQRDIHDVALSTKFLQAAKAYKNVSLLQGYVFFRTHRANSKASRQQHPCPPPLSLSLSLGSFTCASIHVLGPFREEVVSQNPPCPCGGLKYGGLRS